MRFLSINKLFSYAEEFGWYVFLAALPLQTRHIFNFQPWGFVEWNAISLYATDLVFFGLLFLWAVRRDWKTWRRPDLVDGAAMLLVIAAGISIKNSSHFQTSLYQWGKLLQGVMLFWYVRHYAIRRFDAAQSLGAFLAGGLLQSMIAIGQFIAQRDLGLWFLGESVLSPNLKGIASFYISAQNKVIRAYGTTPHPNILAAYLAAAIMGYWYWFLRLVRQYRFALVSLAGYGVVLFAFLMTFSRTVIFAWALGAVVLVLILLARRQTRQWLWDERKRVATLAVATVVFGLMFTAIYWPEIVARFTISSDEEAVTLRLYYGKQAFGVGGGGWNWTGIGMGNFVNWFIDTVANLPRYLYQPVHNVFLLAYSETGILGLAALVVFLKTVAWRYVRRTPSDFLAHAMIGVAGSILIFVAMFDHFPWTLQQGRLLWWGLLALAAL